MLLVFLRQEIGRTRKRRKSPGTQGGKNALSGGFMYVSLEAAAWLWSLILYAMFCRNVGSEKSSNRWKVETRKL